MCGADEADPAKAIPDPEIKISAAIKRRVKVNVFQKIRKNQIQFRLIV